MKAIFRTVFACLLVCIGLPAVANEAAPVHQTFTLHSAVLHEDRVINVYMPPGYAAHPKTRYPVLYMPDGGMQEDFPHVARDVDTAIRASEMRPMLVVGIENTQRRRDMTAPTEVASDRKIAPKVGGAAAFRAFIADELMPAVRQRYRSNGHTAIVGESLAGLFIMETFFAQPKLFDTYIALSPSLWWNNEALAHAAAARLKAWPPGLQRRLYFSSASDDIIGDALDVLQAALRKDAPAGLTWQYQHWPELKHATTYRGASPIVFRKLFPSQ
ncbi:MAG TPA: alpha/beta hydrolase-fold protein [Gammaproteobacteria bacterium]|nr:alpha/beta hydrolase-fold protein [Gammaproteobacteria bacterium]